MSVSYTTSLSSYSTIFDPSSFVPVDPLNAPVNVTLSDQTNNVFAVGDIVDLIGPGFDQKLVIDGSVSYQGSLYPVVSSGFYNYAYGIAVEATLPIGTDAAPCFLKGTLISVDGGVVAVERLRPGDLIRTASGALRRVRWIGHRDLDASRHPWPATVRPVRVRAHAFGENMPRRDLWLSPEHAVHIDGVLVPIIRLANGATISQEWAEQVSYWHIELDSHDVILAEGLPVESFLDCGTRSGFDNGGPVIALHPDFKPLSRADACAPVLEEGPRVAQIRARFAARAEALGFVRTSEPDLHLVVDGRRIDPANVTGGAHVFNLPQGAGRVELVSRRLRPADDGKDDIRLLGVAVSRLALDGAEVDLATLAEGWHPLESGAGRVWRWTDGRAALVPARQVELTLSAVPTYWVAPEATAAAAA